MSAQALRADYQLQTTLESSTGPAPALQNVGLGNAFVSESVSGVPRIVLAFPEGNGLRLISTGGVVPMASYSIAVLFRFARTDAWRKIVDFRNATDDAGLYNFNRRLQFYLGANNPQGGEVIAPNDWVQVVLTRDASRYVVGYVDGVRQFSFLDAADDSALAARSLVFFKDDLFTEIEGSGGAVARIRLYDGPLGPEEVAALDEFPVAAVPLPASSGWGSGLLAVTLLVLGSILSRRLSASPLAVPAHPAEERLER